MKGVFDVPGHRDVKSMRMVSLRSIPKSHRSVDLEMFLLRKSRERMRKEAHLLEKRTKSLTKQIEAADENISRIQQEMREGMHEKTIPSKHKKSKTQHVESSPPPAYKTISVHY
jgi:chromosome segregation ATPase